MRITLLAWGSRGDVEPLVALGCGLARAGHQVTVAATRDFTPTVLTAGLAAAPFDFEIASLAGDPDGRRWLAGDSRSLADELATMRRLMRRFAAPIAEGVLRLAPASDLLVSGYPTFDAARAAGEALGTPHVHTQLFPMFPTRSGAATMYAPRPKSWSWLNREATRLSLLSGYSMVAASGDLVRRSLGRPSARSLGRPRGRARDHLRAAGQVTTLVAASPLVVPPAPDVGGNVQVTGYWVRRSAGWEPPADLAAFLDGGEAPVFVGFGSMLAGDPAAGAALVKAAAARAGRRLIVPRGAVGSHLEPSAEVHLIDEVPYEWLFPRMAGIVHHGGAGTTGAALRAGVPSLVIPHFGDQPYWGRRVAELAVGPAPLRRRDLEATVLAERIGAFSSPTLRGRAAALGIRLRQEDGVARAVEAISVELARA